MKNYLLVACLFMAQWCLAQQKNEIKPFLPEIMQQYPNVRDMAISPDQSECYFTLESYRKEFSALLYMKKENGKWSKPSVAPFSGQYKDLEPFFSPDGKRLYFASNRPLQEGDDAKDMDIWYVERQNRNWSEPVNIGAPVNTGGDEFYPAITASGNLYFTAQKEDTKGKEDIYVSTWKDKVYREPVSLSETVNSAGYEFNAYVAPDESFMIYTAYQREDGYGSGDLYISFRDAKGSWSKAKNLGESLNSDQMDYCPFVDIKNGTLYFTSQRNHTPASYDKPQSLNRLLEDMLQYSNGQSRLYRVSIANWLENTSANAGK